LVATSDERFLFKLFLGYPCVYIQSVSCGSKVIATDEVAEKTNPSLTYTLVQALAIVASVWS
jgi:hypothetical protein